MPPTECAPDRDTNHDANGDVNGMSVSGMIWLCALVMFVLGL